MGEAPSKGSNMRTSQSIQLKLSEARSRLNAAVEKRNADTTDNAEIVEEMRSASQSLEALEVEYRAALQLEAEEDAAAAAANPDSEKRELDQLIDGSLLGNFMIEAVTGQPVIGKEHELRQAIFGNEAREGVVPVDLLLMEDRADAITNPGAVNDNVGTQASVLERVFTRAVAGRLRVSMPSVPVGVAHYPVMLTGTDAKMLAKDATIESKAATFTAHELKPTRLTARYLFRIEDVHVMRGLESVLRRDLTAVMADKMDDQIINGNGTAPNVNGFLSELSVTAETSKMTWANTFKKYTDIVDGINSYDISDLSTVVGPNMYGQGMTLFRGNNTDTAIIDTLRARLQSFGVTSRIGHSSNVSTGIVAKNAYPGRNAVAPVWRGMEIIRDNITGAASGQIAVTAVMLWNFKIVREDGFQLLSFKSA